MFRNYLKIAIRNLKSNRINSIINILGLSIGITSTLIIAFIINYELGYDSFHTHSDQIYRVVRVSQVEGETEYRTGTSWPLSPAIINEIALLKHMTYMMYWGGVQIDITNSDGSSTNKFQEDKGCAFVNESFFDVFDFKGKGVKWLYGNPETALDEQNSIVLTQSLARKYFNTEMAIGKSIQINQNLDLIVTGVIDDLPSNTNFPFTMICSYSTLYDLLGRRGMESWSSVSDRHQTYIVLPEGMSKSEMETEITKVHEKYVNKDMAAMRSYPLQPLSEVHRDSRFGNYNNKFTSMQNVWILGIVGIFLLMMISINFINISIASSVSRSKEIGLRKVIGGRRAQIIIQFLTETFTLTVFAAIIALITAELLKAELQNLFEFQIDGFFINHRFVVLITLAIIVVVTISAGLYPALVQSGYSPIMIINNTISTKLGTSIRISNALILIQFTFTIMLITSTLIVIQQIRYFNSVDLGFEKDAVINVYLPDNAPASLSTFKSQLLSNSAIAQVSYSSSLPSGLKRSRGYMDIRRKGTNSNDKIIYEYQSVDPEYLDLYRLKLLAGNNLHFSDTNRSVIINQVLMNKLGFASFEECIGAEVDMNLKEPCTITGVLEDFHDQSLKEEFGKIAMIHNPDQFRVASIKFNVPKSGINTENMTNSIEHIQKSWNLIFTNNVFDYEFLDKNIEAFYIEEQRISRMLQHLSVIFLLIGSLGLYGLISFMINKKMKELAIRKILGASILNILILLLKNYLILIAVAFLISFPIVHYLMKGWLQNFNNHINLQWWFFILPPLFVLIVTFLSVGRNTYQAIKTNPASTLRNE
jgi:putative ABC transport system permease protein